MYLMIPMIIMGVFCVGVFCAGYKLGRSETTKKDQNEKHEIIKEISVPAETAEEQKTEINEKEKDILAQLNDPQTFREYVGDWGN